LEGGLQSANVEFNQYLKVRRMSRAEGIAKPTCKSLLILLSSSEYLTKLADVNTLVHRPYFISMPEHANRRIFPMHNIKIIISI
jgi:hypothetical protein